MKDTIIEMYEFLSLIRGQKKRSGKSTVQIDAFLKRHKKQYESLKTLEQ